MKNILIAGGSGFVGENLCLQLARDGYSIHILSRSSHISLPFPHILHTWENSSKLPASLDEFSFKAVVNLCGQGVASSRWTENFKKRLRESRISPTKSLAKFVKDRFIETFIQSSATGYYESSFDKVHTEESKNGKSFLSRLAYDWESAAKADLSSKTRLCILRIGVVIGHGGDFIEALQDIYANGLGAPLASGKQFLSWIHINDLVSVIMKCLEDESYEGAFNAVSPNPVDFNNLHQEFKRFFPCQFVFRAPEFALKLFLGEKSSTVLDSFNVNPSKLEKASFKFKFSKLSHAIDEVFSLREENAPLQSIRFIERNWIKVPLEKAWEFFSNAKNLEAITPDNLNFVIKRAPKDLKVNSIIDYSLSLYGVPFKWQSKIVEWNDGVSFVDKQLKGPYKYWYHRHLFESIGEGTLVTDEVSYKLYGGAFSHLSAGFFIKSELKKIFKYRSESIRNTFLGE